MSTATRALRLGNLSASRTDRPTAMSEVLDGGPVDVLAVDMLSDEALMECAGTHRSGGPGFESALISQLSGCLDRIGPDRVRIVTNAGALDPAGLATALRERAAEAGVDLAVASVDPGDVTDRAADLGLGDVDVATVRHGAFGIAAALRDGAAVVVTGRVSREALVTGAAIAHHGWTTADLDPLAGAVAVGHVLSGGPGATGVVDSTTDVTRTSDPVTGGYPIAELGGDGSAVITRHPCAFGSVTVGTVTDQLLDGVTGARYAAPDVVLRLDTVRLEQEGTDRVRISGARGEAAPTDIAVVGLTEGPGRPARITRPLPQEQAGHRVTLPDGRRWEVPVPSTTSAVGPAQSSTPWNPATVPGGAAVRSPLGSVAGVRRGIVGRGRNLAVWTWDDSAFAWLADELTTERLVDLVPGIEGAQVCRYLLPNLRAVNLVVRCPRGVEPDPALGAELASALLEIPGELLEVDP